MAVACPRCHTGFPDDALPAQQAEIRCPVCTKTLNLSVFPALFRERDSIDTARLAAAADDSVCYQHSGKRASRVCERCGRFVCSLCEVAVGNVIWCPPCTVAAQTQTAAAGDPLERERTLYDSIALAVATLPVLIWYSSIVTAPITIYLCIRYWKKPSSLIPRTKWRFVVAVILALLQLTALIAGVVYLKTQGLFDGKAPA